MHLHLCVNIQYISCHRVTTLPLKFLHNLDVSLYYFLLFSSLYLWNTETNFFIIFEKTDPNVRSHIITNYNTHQIVGFFVCSVYVCVYVTSLFFQSQHTSLLPCHKNSLMLKAILYRKETLKYNFREFYDIIIRWCIFLYMRMQ